VALSRGSRLLDVIQRFALWSPDFPHSYTERGHLGYSDILP